MTALAAGGITTCAIVAGNVECWGDGRLGGLGNGTLSVSLTPVAIANISGATALGAGVDNNCAVVTGGGVACWGNNEYGQLGDGTTTQSATPVVVKNLTGATAIAVGSDFGCALLSGGAVSCWGDNSVGQSGGSKLTGVTAIAAGSRHACALTSGGAVFCWGVNGDGGLGNRSNRASNTPVAVYGLSSGATSITAGNAHSCATLADGSVWCWGGNFGSAIGYGTTFLSP